MAQEVFHAWLLDASKLSKSISTTTLKCSCSDWCS